MDAKHEALNLKHETSTKLKAPNKKQNSFGYCWACRRISISAIFPKVRLRLGEKYSW